MLTGNFLLHRVLHFLLLSENRIFASLHWKICCAPKRIQKTWVHSPIHHHLNSRRRLKTPPPKRIQKSPYTNPTPPIEQQTHLKRHRAKRHPARQSPPKRIQKISIHSPIHTTNWTSNNTSSCTLPDSPPKKVWPHFFFAPLLFFSLML